MTMREWWVMTAMMAGIILSPLTVMFTSIALPTMRNHFQVDVELATWIGTAYFIPSVALMPIQSQLGQRWGFRRIYGAGLLIFALGAIWTALAPAFSWLLAGRIIQGLGWSALYPLALILINTQFPAGKQGEMVGLWESSVGLTTIIAPLVGGALVQYLGWQSLYVAMGIVAVLGLVLTMFVIPPGEEVAHKARSDWASVLLLTLALVLTLLGITRRNPLALILAVACWVAWFVIAGRLKISTISPTLFQNRRFIGASVAANIRMLAAIAALTALPLFFEDVQGLSPAQVGAIMVSYSLLLFLGSWPGGRWSDRAGALVPGVVGYLAMIIGVLLLLGLGPQFVLWLAAIALAIRGFGAGLSQAPYAKAATEAVPPEHKQGAAGLYGTIRYSGLALGTGLVGIFLQARLTDYDALSGGAAALPAYRELWLILALILAVGLIATYLMGHRQEIESLASV